MPEPTKAELIRENERLREENEKMRYVASCLLDSGRAEREAMRHQADASTHLLNALTHFTLPTIPNN